MADYKGVELTQKDSSPQNLLKANESYGRVRMERFTFTTDASLGLATGEKVELVRLPAGARILEGHAAFEAMSSAGGTAGMLIGTSADDDRYLAETSVDSAGSTKFANTVALNHGEEVSVETSIYAKAATEAWAVSKQLNGYVLYVID